ncbi:amidohydrolase family protein [Thermanaeromonas sp. C210]|uniref:amidohydrolase family protein n=1 Tax=Thermanaeromonas sp. C210 TaxID=2731925 RepID=UPI00155B9586|nr:amidohydrolase [Thermanaeromonas sp. C210]GFN24248.1 amidohydrolase [Thermanaeromonas sp. C210]
MKCDILIKDCALLTPDFEIVEDQTVAIDNTRIAAIGPSRELNGKYEGDTVIAGKGKLLMPGLVDAHTHTCQQLLRGRTMDEYPMIWARILVPFESNLSEDDVYYSAQLSCLEMIKSGTTAFADSGGVHMPRVVEAVLESGMRAAISRSTMDMGGFIPDCMKDTPEEAIRKTEELYKSYHGAGGGRIHIWFAIRQVMTCSPELIRLVGEKAREYRTGIHAHLAEHRDEVSFCLQKYQKRPAEYLDSLGALGPNLLTAHNVALSENELELLKERDVKIVHCPRANFGSHGFPKTPRMVRLGLSIGIGSDGAAGSSLSLFDEIRVFRSGIHAFWGLPIFDPVVLPAKELIKMATLGGARALQLDHEIGTIEVGKKADVILINIDQPHIAPTHNLINTLVEAVTGNDVRDVIIDGKVVMKDREVLTLDEERILFETKRRLGEIAARAGI